MMQRVEKLMELGGQDGVYVLHKSENIRHFSGYTGEGMLVFGHGVRVLVTDFRYDEQAQKQAPGWEVSLIGAGNTHAQRIAQAAARIGGDVRVETDFLSMQAGQVLAQALEALGSQKIIPMEGLPEKLRMIKEPEEIELIARAAKITDATFSYVLDTIKPGMSELELELLMFVHMKELGADGLAFPSIVASGPNTSLPHAEPGERRIQAGDLITLDFGARYGGYCSDFTRTFAIGRVEPELRRIYDIVLEAQLRSLDALMAGKTGFEVDAVGRGIIAEAGYGEQFGHGLGHAVGRMIHEDPRLSPRGGDTVLREGMVVTVEPGIYLSGRGGVRIEDLCLVKQGGNRVFSASTKEWIEI